MVPISSLAATLMPSCRKHIGLCNRDSILLENSCFCPGCGCAQQRAKPCRNTTRQDVEACRRRWAPSRGERRWNDIQVAEAEGKLKSETVYLIHPCWVLTP